MIVVSKNAVPAKTLQELLGWLKAKPGPPTAGTAGAGSGSHIAGLYFENVTGIKLQYVPYRGTAPALNDLVAGQIDIIIDQTSNSISQVRAGTIRAYAVTDDKRVGSAPDIPSTDEAGLPGFHMTLWSGLWVPKGTPNDIITKLNAAAVAALNDPAVRKKLEDLGLEMPPKDQLAPDALGAWQKAEIAKWWPMIKARQRQGRVIRHLPVGEASARKAGRRRLYSPYARPIHLIWNYYSQACIVPRVARLTRVNVPSAVNALHRARGNFR